MPEIDVVRRIKDLCSAYGWTVYRLAKESGITYSTLNSMLNKGTMPSIPTLSRICRGLGISLSQFFAEDKVLACLTAEQHELLENWNCLSESNKINALRFMKYLMTQEQVK